jgi:uncharacterized protein (DUF302 family)
LAVLLLLVAAAGVPADASSHREAPLVTELPKVDASDFYIFRSYEPGREGFVTLVANYLPLQDPYGGPNYFALDPDAEYVIHIDQDGDGIEDLSFLFDIQPRLEAQTLDVGGVPVPIPLVQSGPVTGPGAVNRSESYRVYVVRGELGGVVRGPSGLTASGDETGETGETEVTKDHLASAQLVTNRRTGSTRFAKPLDNIGTKTFPDYAGYARLHVHDVGIPGCGDGRLFVGQRKDPFVVNLGDTFDLLNLDPVGSPHGGEDDLAAKNVTTLALEVPIDCLTGSGPTVGAWTTARLPKIQRLQTAPTFERPTAEAGTLVQVSRLGMPLVNEVVIGLEDKNLFNAARPDGDAALAGYVTHPTLPEVIELLFADAGVQAPNNFPRRDLVAAFATGIPELNLLTDGEPHEMLRLNTSIAPTPRATQRHLGVLDGDRAGFPNGRRPGDDVVDIELRVAMGVLCHASPGAFGCTPADAPSGDLPYTDGAYVAANDFDDVFPYLTTPIPGSAETGRGDAGDGGDSGDDAAAADVAGLVVLPSDATAKTTADRLQAAIEGNEALRLVFRLDHAANAASVGLTLPPTELVVFGNPNLGTPLMQESQTVAIDLPQKFLAWSTADGEDTFLAYNDPSYLAQRHGITENTEILETISGALGNLASGATGAATGEATTGAGSVGYLEGLVRVQSTRSVDDTFAALVAAIEGNENLGLVAQIDHAANAASVGLTLRPTKLAVFGNPKLGTPLMADERTVGIDLPQKVLVYEAADGTVFVAYNDPFYLAERHGIRATGGQRERLSTIAGALAGLANGAAGD